MSLAIWGLGSHSVACHPTQVNTPALTPAGQACTWFTYPGWMEGWVDLCDWLHTEMVYPPQTVTHPSTNPAVHGRASNSQPVDYKSDALTTTLPCYLLCKCTVLKSLCEVNNKQQELCFSGLSLITMMTTIMIKVIIINNKIHVQMNTESVQCLPVKYHK